MFDDDFWLDDEDTQVAEESLDTQAALKLISKLYQKPNGDDDYQLNYIVHLLENDLLELMGNISVQDEQLRDIYNQLYTLSAKTVEQYRLPILSGKAVVGVGGMFSAGKSSFLNALTSSELLPNDQQKCTAVATYMAAGAFESINAYTASGQVVPLDSEELQAISHKFYDSYGVGFAEVINKMSMTLPQFKWPDIVLLDTPGYNSDYLDGNSSTDIKNDKRVAREHLSNCDYLIWLVDIENGVIPPDDIAFIKSLHLVNKVLFILNKADKRTDEQVETVLYECEKSLQDSQVPYAAITSFSSRTEAGECLGQVHLQEFLKFASDNASSGRNAEVSNQLSQLAYQSEMIIKGKQTEFDKEIRKIKQGILSIKDPRHMSSLLYSYRLLLRQSTRAYWQSKRLTELFREILLKLSRLEGRKK